MTIYLDTNFPKSLVEAIQHVHKLQTPPSFSIVRTQRFEENNACVFIFDQSKKGVDIVTYKHFEAGFKVFAFKTNSADSIDFFQLALTTLRLWPRMLEKMSSTQEPFICTYKYLSTSVTKII